MKVYEYSTCNKCKVSYKGLFRVRGDGTIECYDCDKKQIIPKLEYKKVNLTDEDVVQEVVKDMLKKDLNRIYLSKVLEGKDELHSIRDANGNINSKKMYFQNNSIDLVIQMQRDAYKALTYIEMGEDLEHRDFAKKVFDLYIDARHRKFDVEEEKEIREMLEASEMRSIIMGVAT